MAWTIDIRVAHDFILAGGGESIRTFMVGYKMFDKRMHGAQMVDDFLDYCHKVTSLSVNEDLGWIWAERFGGRFELLEIATTHSALDAIGKYCASLRELTVHSYLLWNDLEYDGDGSLCAGSARTLESFKFVGSGLHAPHIVGIQATCRAMKRVAIRGNRFNCDAI